MNLIPIFTKRLSLIPITVELCEADLISRQNLKGLLNAMIPDSWPPALVTEETIRTFISLLQAEGGSRFIAYYWLLNSVLPSKQHILIGSGGFIRGEDNIPELGYSVLDEFQGMGYATEAVNAMILFIFGDPNLKAVKATTYPDLTPSIRVLEKNGFQFCGSDVEAGTMSYYLNR